MAEVQDRLVEMRAKYDGLFDFVNSFGRYQKILFFGTSVCFNIAIGAHSALRILAMGTPRFNCAATNSSCPPNQCCDNCTTYEFEEGQFTSTVTEWNLICSRSYLSAVIRSCFSFGMLIGSLAGGLFSDAYGRRNCMILACVMMVITSISSSFADSVPLFSFLQIFVGIFSVSISLSQYTFNMEILGPEKRTMAGQINQAFLGPGCTVAALIGYFVRDWRLLIILCSLLPTPFLLFFKVFPESPSWLITHNRRQEAENNRREEAENIRLVEAENNRREEAENKRRKEAENNRREETENNRREEAENNRREEAENNLLEEAENNLEEAENNLEEAENNRLKEAENVLSKFGLREGAQREDLKSLIENISRDQSEQKTTRESKLTLLDLFRTPKLRKRSLIVAYVWFVTVLVYSGIFLYITNLSGNLYLNIALMNNVHIPQYFICWFFMNRFGRRKPHVVYLFLTAVCFLVIPVLPAGCPVMTTVFAILGKSFINVSLSNILLITSQLYTSGNRNTALGMGSMVARIGTIMIPYIVTLLPGSLPLIIFGMGALLAAVFSWFLPETLDNSPQTIQEAEEMDDPGILCCRHKRNDDGGES